MTTQPLEREVRAVKDDMEDVKDLLRETARFTAANTEQIARNSLAIDANAQAIGALGAKVDANAQAIGALGAKVDANAQAIGALGAKVDANAQAIDALGAKVDALIPQIEANNRRIDALIPQVEALTTEVSLMAKAVVAQYGDFRAEYGEGPSGRSDDWPMPKWPPAAGSQTRANAPIPRALQSPANAAWLGGTRRC